MKTESETDNLAALPGEAGAPESIFRGSRKEVGRLHGRTFSVQVRRELSLALESCCRDFSLDTEAMLAHTKRFVPWIRRNLPQLMPEVEGLAEGAGISEDAALFLVVSDGLRSSPDGNCTSFYCGAESTADGSVFLGQTKDTPPRDGRYFVMRWSYDDGLEMIVLNYAGWLANIGMTSHGVGLCGNSLYAKEHARECRPFSLLKRGILESRNVSEAMQYVEVGGWQDGCLGVADQSGKAAFVELILGRSHCRRMTGEAVGHANSIQTPELRHLDRSAEASACSLTRQKTVDRILAEGTGRITEKSLRALLADHEQKPESICRHPKPGDENRTTAAFLANLSAGWMDVAIGNPCSTAFHRHRVTLRAHG
jgi:isopenicillin-N N-acyltransferase like protein